MVTRGGGEPICWPRLLAGRTRTGQEAVEAWVTAAWLLAVEGRALIEDLEGGREQPALRRAVKLRLVELICQVDAHLAREAPPDDLHALALALEYGFGQVVQADGPQVLEWFQLDEDLEGAGAATDRVVALWGRLVDEFPGRLPDPLLSEGQGQMLRALRGWSKLAARTGVDAAFLKPFLQDA
jgi:hypothetical protein